MPSKKNSTTPDKGDFDSLVSSIVHLHRQTQEFATKAVNVALTLRNWLIGRQIELYERNGADRTAYGDKLMDTLANRLVKQGWERCERRELYRHRQFYLAYPRIMDSVTPQSPLAPELRALLTDFPPTSAGIGESVTPESQIVETLSPQFLSPHPELMFRLSFSHLAEIIQIHDETQRRFYEIECIRGNWSVRELRRQIASLYYERSGLSQDKAALSKLAHQAAETAMPAHVVRDPYIFEFLGLRSRDVMGESGLEDALLDRLQDFLLELGHGFCFEARQKRILIGDEHFFVDLVFYHRMLKCHILVELKTDAFRHEHLGQLNTYVAYYKKHQMTQGDQPPIGILLCTHKNDALVEFALGDLSNQVFVSRYAVELPRKEEMERFMAQIGKDAGP
jgi:predicted nuclease of restriction endonuclease-like (RecB) superfamily